MRLILTERALEYEIGKKELWFREKISKEKLC